MYKEVDVSINYCKFSDVLDFRLSSFGSVSLSDCYLSEMLYMNEIIAQFSVPDNCKRVRFENQRITKSVT